MRASLFAAANCALAHVTLLLISLSAAPSVAAYQGSTKAETLWAQAITAKGGRERLVAVESLHLTSNSKYIGDDELWLFPSRAFRWSIVKKREETSILVYNLTRPVVWWQALGQPGKPIRDPLESVWDIEHVQVTTLLMTKWLEPRPLRAREEWDNLRRVDVVETDAAGWPITFYFDRKTHLAYKIRYAVSPEGRARGELKFILLLSDYREINGIMMPTRMRQRVVDLVGEEDHRLTYEFNVDYDPAIFEQPPTVGMGPEAWRRRPKAPGPK